MENKKFEATRESVDTHEIPAWYEDAKFGIFIHWSLFSVPAYAPIRTENIMELGKKEGLESSMKYNPYSEWYLNTMRIEGSPTQEHHRKTYGDDFSYFAFQKQFEEGSIDVDFEGWADFFKECGAKYVVLVTKHHDGYCLWPSDYKNPFDAEYQSKRDLVGEFTKAMRSRGIKVGLYYSGIFDWTFKKEPIDSMKNFIKQMISSDEYAEYATHHVYELIEKYKPEILWNDIGFPGQADLNKIFADYYNAVPEGVVNNRWTQVPLPENTPDETIEQYLAARNKDRSNLQSALMATGTHCDYTTPEYISVEGKLEKKFEATRGIGFSFGYNEQENKERMLTADQMIHSLTDIVSKSGNFLLNVGPMANGVIPQMQKEPLQDLGKWLKVNGEAIYGTRPLDKSSSTTTDGKQVRFTSKGNTLYAIILASDIERALTITNLQISENAVVTLLGNEEILSWKQDGEGLTIDIPMDQEIQSAYTLKIEG